MLSEISQRKTNTVQFHLYVESKKQNNIKEKQLLSEGRWGWDWGKELMREIKRYKLPVAWVRDSVENIVNNQVVSLYGHRL